MSDEIGKEFLGRGWRFPLRLEAQSGQVTSVAYEPDIEQSIFIILSTSRGERVMRPDFGCGIHDLVFAAINTSLITRIKQTVNEALRKYEARIDIIKVSVDQTRVSRGRLDVIIDFRVRTTNQSGNYVFPFYFKEAS